jgi:hypothetical protein
MLSRVSTATESVQRARTFYTVVEPLPRIARIPRLACTTVRKTGPWPAKDAGADAGGYKEEWRGLRICPASLAMAIRVPSPPNVPSGAVARLIVPSISNSRRQPLPSGDPPQSPLRVIAVRTATRSPTSPLSDAQLVNPNRSRRGGLQRCSRCDQRVGAHSLARIGWPSANRAPSRSPFTFSWGWTVLHRGTQSGKGLRGRGGGGGGAGGGGQGRLRWARGRWRRAPPACREQAQAHGPGGPGGTHCPGRAGRGTRTGFYLSLLLILTLLFS